MVINIQIRFDNNECVSAVITMHLITYRGVLQHVIFFIS